MTIRASRLEGTWRLKIPAIVPHNLLHEAVTSLIHVANGLVVGVILRLQQLWVCLHARLDLERSKLDGVGRLCISTIHQALVFSTELHCLLHHAINLSLRQRCICW